MYDDWNIVIFSIKYFIRLCKSEKINNLVHCFCINMQQTVCSTVYGYLGLLSVIYMQYMQFGKQACTAASVRLCMKTL